jgi:hypothetical protein
MGVMTPKSVLVGYLRCQASQVIRFCTSRNRNAIIGPPSAPTCPLLHHCPESEEAHEETDVSEHAGVEKEELVL